MAIIKKNPDTATDSKNETAVVTSEQNSSAKTSIPEVKPSTAADNKASICTPPKAKLTAIVAGLALLGVIGTGTAFFVGQKMGEDKHQAAIAVSKGEMEKAVAALGEISETAEGDNLTAYVVKTNNGPQVVYGTGDGKTLILGDVYEAKSGNPLFTDLLKKVFAPDSANNADSATNAESAAISAMSGDPEASAPGQLIGEYKGELPEVFSYLEKLGGYKEDPSVGPESTLYIVYDPRCPYCHEMYEKTRKIDMKAKGVTIKWLPTVALGNEGPEAESTKRAVAGLYIKNATELGETFGSMAQAPGVDKVTEEDVQKLNENLSMLIEVTTQVYGADARASVPTGFYLDKKTGKPRALKSAQSDEALRAVFGDI